MNLRKRTRQKSARYWHLTCCKEGLELSLYGDVAQFTRVLGNETKHQEQATQPRQGHVVAYIGMNKLSHVR